MVETKRPLPIDGLLPLVKDKRDFSLGGYFGRYPIEDVPKTDFLIADPELKDQGPDDTCAAFAVTTASEPQEGVILSPGYQFAKMKQILGKIEGFGADLRTAGKSAVKYGSIEQADDPFVGKSRDFIADWTNWPKEFDVKARIHRKGSFFFVDGQDNLFDSIRSALWQFREEKRLVTSGALWRYSWSLIEDGIIRDQQYIKKGFGHAFTFKGQKIIEDEIYLIAHLSNGKEVGDNGLFYFPRGVVNRELVRYGAIMFKDENKERVKKFHWSYLQKLIDLFR